MVFSKVGQSALAMVVTSRLDSVLAAWRQNLLLKTLMFSITAAATCALAWAIRRRLLERRQADAELRIAATAFESQEATMVTDAQGVVLRVNRAFTETTGYGPEEIIGKTPKLLHSGRQDAAFYRAMRDSLERTGAWQGEIWNRRKSGEMYPKWLTISAVRDRLGAVTHYIGTDYDVSERKRAEQTINTLAFYDQLTGLPNRALFLDRLKQTTSASARSGSCCALLLIDLDDFKSLNDTRGHEAGDGLLKQVADRLRAFSRDNDTVARLGGDEFVVMLPGLSPNEQEAATATEAVAEKILASLVQPYMLGDAVYHGAASIGAAVHRGQQLSFDQIMKQAELAMYRAKAAGHNVVRFYDQAMEAAVRHRMELENDLRHAISEEQFLLHYQPQVIGEGRVTGAEALVRWQHPSRGLMAPAAFIPLAEETDLILPLGVWVLRIACRRLALWAARPGLADLTISVNVSPSQFRQRDFVDQVLSIVDETGADPRRLKLELTESLLVHDVEAVIEKMDALRAKGIRFSLDDFGTGYSSLSYLKRLPLDQLKIDQSFVREVLSDSNAAAIAKTIVALGQSLGLAVIAEGVETSAERAFLASLGCHAYQGSLFGKPVADAQFERLSCREIESAVPV
jgi:diguanylate cyclase (GGDEF)-like protein/PAS domain S-box-containing protein